MRLIPLLAGYSGSLAIPSSSLTYAGAAVDSWELVDGVTFLKITVSSGTTAIGVARDGQFNPHGFVDGVNLDDPIQMRWQDLVQFEIASGASAWGAIGIIGGSNIEDLNGIGWVTDNDGYWRSFIRDCPRDDREHWRTLRSIQHNDLPWADIQSLGLLFDGKSRTIYWIANGEVKDFYTPNSDGIAAFKGVRGLEYWTYVDNSVGVLRFHGGGDPYILAIGLEDEAVVPTPASVDTPTITADGVTDSSVILNGSTFVHNPGTSEHLASQWQVTLATDPTFLSPVLDTDWDCKNLVQVLISNLIHTTNYLARVRYIAEDGAISSWSTPVAFTTATPSDPGGSYSPETPSDPTWSDCGAVSYPTSWNSE